jgi:predicted DNA-binding transcriptional regulator AlpA
VTAKNEPQGSSQRGDTRFAAHYTGQSRSRLEKLRCFGGGPEFIKLGRRVVYDSADLDLWLAGQKRRSTSGYAADHTFKSK